jgi:dipeptidyl aminopeptidase/acylaminoacyl peptidase
VLRFAIVLYLAAFLAPHIYGEVKRPITVQDIVETTRLADSNYFSGQSSAGRVAHFSPDGRHFVIILRKGNLKENVNAYSMYLFSTDRVFRSGRPHLLLTMRSNSNRAAIREIKWLADDRTIAFAGEREGSLSQVYTINIVSRHTTQITTHHSSVDHFDISLDGRSLLFSAEAVQHDDITVQQRRTGVLIENQTLADVMSDRFNHIAGEEQLFYQTTSKTVAHVPSEVQINSNSTFQFSPDGRYALVRAYFREPHSQWAIYDNHSLKLWASRVPPLEAASSVFQFFLFNCATATTKPLLDAPAYYTSEAYWAPDSRAIFLKSFLPLSSKSSTEYLERTKGELPARISVPNLKLQRIPVETWSQTRNRTIQSNRPLITLRESINDPPAIFATDTHHRNSFLMELNPQFRELSFGQVRTIRFSVGKTAMEAGLYLPPDHIPGKRYPLVIQTHGYDPDRFSMDGRNEWSSAFAARALAAAGIIVVQMEKFASAADHEEVAGNRSLGATQEAAFRTNAGLGYAQVITDLDNQGLIDPNLVGVSGFSRTVWFASYALTHGLGRFRTAVLTDGIDGGYFEYIARRLTELDTDNGGLAPLSSAGLDLWMKESPSFNIDKVHIPVRIVSIEGPMPSSWDWFVSLKLQHKPVEMMAIPGGTHLLERPRDRYIAMQGLVDWFRFWLQDYSDPAPAKAAQYVRWSGFRAIASDYSPRSDHQR